jgi:hypothetical protein
MRTEYSKLDGSLDERVDAYLSSLVGENLSQTDGGFDLRTRAAIGAVMEFGIGAVMSYPDARSVTLVIAGREFSIGV